MKRGVSNAILNIKDNQWKMKQDQCNIKHHCKIVTKVLKNTVDSGFTCSSSNKYHSTPNMKIRKN